jgi:hypothetical protein
MRNEERKDQISIKKFHNYKHRVEINRIKEENMVN